MDPNQPDLTRTQMTPMDEAELRVFYKTFLKSYGRIQLLQAIDTMQKCVVVALDVLKENW